MGWTDVHLLHPLPHLVEAPRDDPIAEFDAASPAPQFGHHEPMWPAPADEQPVAFAVRSQEHIVVVALHHRVEVGIERDLDLALHQRGPPEVLEIRLGGLLAVHPAYTA